MTQQISLRAIKALDEVDRMPPELRGCVHEFGPAIVTACLQAGVRRPEAIRQLVHEIWMGGRHQSQRGVGNGLTRVASVLDWMLSNSGSSLSAKGLTRELLMNSMVIVPREPSPQAVAASIEAIRGMGLLTKTEKHTIRLRAAIAASAKQSWPHLFEGS